MRHKVLMDGEFQMFTKSLLINDWLDYLESVAGKSDNTIKNYYYDIRIFFRFIKFRKSLVDKSISIDDLSSIKIDDIDLELMKKIDIRDLIAYVSYLDKYMNSSASTKLRRISSLKNIYHYLVNITKVLDHNPSDSLESPKRTKRYPIYLDLEDIKKLLESILEGENIFLKKRDYAIVMTFLNTGIRLSELSNLNLDDISADRSINIIGKGNKQRIIYANDAVINSINEYLEIRPNVEENALFLNIKNKRFGNRGIEHMLSKYLKMSGLDNKGYSPHKLRHTAATLLHKYGNVEIRTLQVLLGHESVSTTQIYTHVDNEDLKVAIDSNPLKNLKIE
ncbi:MAG: tyrosine recombinase XerC [Tissierellia bacterium]|nr:tyrosine recombinase XerC [Tissierellia bacterium]